MENSKPAGGAGGSGLTAPELGFLVVFWLGAWVSSFYIGDITKLPPFVALANGLVFMFDQSAFMLAVVTVIASLYGMYVFRESLARYLILIVKKLTKSKRR